MAVFLSQRGAENSTQASATGTAGENRVAKLLIKAGYPVITDITIPYSGGTHQLDHVVLIENGLAVLETKTWRGQVTGTLKHPQWRLNRPNKQPVTVYNPIMQNDTHAAVLQGMTGARVTAFVVSAGHFSAPSDVMRFIVTLDELCNQLGRPGALESRAGRAFEKLARMKLSGRQEQLGRHHHAKMRFRKGMGMAGVFWLLAGLGLFFEVATAYQAGQ